MGKLNESEKKLLARLSLWTAYGLLFLAAAITLVPMLWLVCAAVKSRDDFFTSVFLPSGGGFLGIGWDRLTRDNFQRLFSELHFGGAVLNSLFYASTSSILGTLFCAMGGFALAKYEFRGRTACVFLVLGTLIIPGPLLLAPGYQWLWKLGLLNTYAGLVLPGVAGAFGVFLFRQSMVNNVPQELLEAARIDGSGEFRIFLTIVLPLVRPTVGAFLLITFLGAWNNFITPQIIMQSPENYPLSVAIAQLKGTYSQDYGMLMAGTLVSVAPVMALFLFLQKEFIEGLAAGATKG